MQIGLLIIIAGLAFMIAIGWPATWVTILIMEKLGILPDKQTDNEKRYKYDHIYWSLFFYFCVVVYLIESFLYSKIRYDENNFIGNFLLFLVATIIIVFRCLMILNEGKLLPKLLNAFGRLILFLWIAIIVLCLVIGVGVFIFT